ncbi:tubulin-like doman-containing protein [Haloglomus halophilum]|uniref:tubulin-like doman-containing protein n=1 Tax=Haloglomus halophilum TaxID=2962672 RepID=UPI0020C96D25|nr:tubulin-like doman-containing protein [Haloglomus halophilum]
MNRPTVVVGIGAGGARMLAAVADRVGAVADGNGSDWTGEADIDPDRFSFIAVDTDEGDLGTEAPAVAETVTLGPPDANAERSYLAAPPSATEPGSGLRRRRALARLALESGGNLAAVRSALDTAIGEAAAVENAEDGIDVWLLAGLGGGIGGGSLPLLTALVADIADELRLPVSTYAFGSLPSSTGDATSAIHARNAYVTVRELQALLPGSETASPIELELPLAEAVLGRPAITLDEPPLAGLFLAPVDDEGRVTPVERAAATTAVGHALTNGRPDLAFDNATFGQEPGPPIYGVTAGRVTLPVDDLDRLFDVRSDRLAVTDQLEDLENRIDGLDADIDWLSTILDADLDGERVPDGIEDAVFHYPERRVEDADVDALAQGRVDLQAHIDSVVSEVGRAVPKRVPTRPVVALILGHGLAKRLDEAVDGHPFPATLNETTSEYGDAVDAVLAERGEDGLPSEPLGAWRQVVKPALSNEAESLSAAAEDRLNPIASRRLRKQAEAVNGRAAELDDLADAFATLTAVREAARERAGEARERLRERRDELERERDTVRRKHDSMSESRREITRRRDDLRERLSHPRITEGGRHRQVPLTNVADLIPETLSFANSLAELVAEGFVDESDIATELTTLVVALSDPVHDPDGDAAPESRLVMATARENRWGPAGDLLALAPEDGPDVQAALAEAFDDRIGVDDGRGFAVDLAGLYAPVSLPEMRTLGALHEAFEDPARSVSEVFDDLDDAAVRDAIAYPELLPEGTQGAKQREVADAIADIEMDSDNSRPFDRD